VYNTCKLTSKCIKWYLKISSLCLWIKMNFFIEYQKNFAIINEYIYNRYLDLKQKSVYYAIWYILIEDITEYFNFHFKIVDILYQKIRFFLINNYIFESWIQTFFIFIYLIRRFFLNHLKVIYKKKFCISIINFQKLKNKNF
jgi:hypothetical protein